MWTRLKAPCWRRCGAAGRTSHCGIARERCVRAPTSVRGSSAVPQTYYDVLGVEATASADDIKSAFRRQAKLVHPDVSKSADSEEDFKQLKEAYDVLSDSDQRAEYDEALRRAARRRSSQGAGSSTSGRRVVIMEDDPWGFGGTTVEVVMEGLDSDDDDDEDGLLDELEYVAWAATAGNMRSSYQSSWQANSRKARRAQRQQAAAKAAMKAKLSQDDKLELLQEMPVQVRAAAQQVFGARLQSLNNLEELGEVIEAVMEMNAMGIQFEFLNNGGSNEKGSAGGRSTARGSRRQGGGAGTGGGAKARRPSGGSSGSSSTGGRRRRM